MQRLPLRGGGWSSGIEVEGAPPADVSTTYVRFVSHEYLQTVGVALREDVVAPVPLAHPPEAMAPGFISGFFTVPVRNTLEES